MPSETEQLLSSAVVKIRDKVTPTSIKDLKPINSKKPDYEVLFPLLDVWDKDCLDEDTIKKTSYIFDYISANGDGGPRDKIMSILQRLGATPPSESRISRVFKYCKLHKQANSLMREYEVLQGDINALSNKHLSA